MTDSKAIKERFKSSIRRGTGEAHLLMQSNPTVDFSAYIIKASLTNFAYDGQSEGSRALYISELIALSKQQNKIQKAILRGLKTEQQDTWALDQLFDLAAIFAKQGNTEARQAIYDRFSKNPIDHSEWVGQDAILDIDGIKGLIYIAAVKGEIISNNPEEWDDGWMADYFQQQNPGIEVYKALEKESKHNKFVEVYLATIKKHRTEFQKRVRPAYNYEIVSEKINSKAIVPLPTVGAKELSKEDIQRLADDFLKESNQLKLEKYMRVFDKVKYPYHYQPILSLAKSKNRKDSRLVEFAAGALKYFSGKDIREFAIERLQKVKIPADYLNMLVSNYKQGDSVLLTEIAGRCKNEHDVHALVDGYINIYTINKTKECKEPLEAIYHTLTCGIHRTDIIKILIANKALSRQLKAEIKYDSSEETRNLISRK